MKELLEKLIWPGEITVFYGKPAAGKTMTCLAYCARMRPAIFIYTEGGSAISLKHKLKKVFGVEDGVHFIVARTEDDLNRLLGGRTGDEKVRPLHKRIDFNPKLIVVDSITWFYSGKVKRTKTNIGLITKEFQGKVELWARYLFQFKCPIIWTAQQKSVYGKIMEEAEKKKKKGKEQEEPKEEEPKKIEQEFIGGSQIAHATKTWVRFEGLDEEPLRFRLTIRRGDDMHKTAILSLDDLIRFAGGEI